LAAAAIAARLGGGAAAGCPPDSAALCAIGATFVTLESAGSLRGCIGSLDAVRPLYLDVARNAVRAMTDPRLPPVTAADWPELDVSVSVLSTPEPLPAGGLAELAGALRPGVDGLILTDEVRRATFLPVVWAKLTQPVEFVSALLVKGGWPAGEWPAEMRAARYAVVEFHSRAPRAPFERANRETL
ncbi:MAG TPA: AmmeMemoRadiSam system protein A, partial [Micromonosporaceae bacterium]|nr:AmmeMemoRadiSam system protein A [Micromonosporaceae bacterium]